MSTTLPTILGGISSILLAEAFSDNKNICSDWLCWCMIYCCSKAYSVFRSTKIKSAESSSINEVAFAIVIASVCQTLGDVKWLTVRYPYLTSSIMHQQDMVYADSGFPLANGFSVNPLLPPAHRGWLAGSCQQKIG